MSSDAYKNLSSSSSFLPYDYLFCQSLIYTFTAEKHQNNIKMYTSIALLAASAGLATAATSYKASFTQYGSTDTWGSGNCNVATTACGFYTSVRYLPSPLPSLLSSVLDRFTNIHHSQVTQPQYPKTNSA